MLGREEVLGEGRLLLLRAVTDAGFEVRLLSGGNLLAKARSLRSIINEVEPKLIYTALFDSDVVGRIASIGLDVPVVTNLTNTAYDPARLDDPKVNAGRLQAVRFFDAATARMLSDHFHAVSQAVKDSTVQTMGIDPSRVTVIHRGRDATALTVADPVERAAARSALGIADDEQIVLTVGRQEYQKGQIHLIRALPLILERAPKVRLLIAGRQGHASPRLEAAIDELGLRDRVELLGHRPDVAAVLSAADLFAFPSVYEGLGGALIEALAAGLPVVASDIPALREVVVEGGNALLVPPADSAALAEAVIELLGDEARRKDFSKHSRRIFEDRFTAQQASQRLVEYLAGLAR